MRRRTEPALRAIVAIAAALAFAACAPSPRCDLIASGEASFSAASAHDAVEARALGETCSGAAAVLIVRDPEGVPIWAWAAPFYPTFGDGFAPHADGAGPSRAALTDFLTRWTHVTTARTSAAPAWSDGLDTRLERAVYEDVRARDLPMLCHLAGVAREQCVYWEPGAAVAGAFYARDVGLPAPAQPPPRPDERSDRR